MPRILLVEDEPAIADTVLYALRTEGFEARHCLTGGEALRVAGEEAFDLAILDVGLPDIGGFALCRELRRAKSQVGIDLPVIFLTAHDAEAERIMGLEIGADDYVTKPFSPRELVARVRVVLRRGHGGGGGARRPHGVENNTEGHPHPKSGPQLARTR
jgi:two-component system catabolic regulation response regulator CreB